MWGIHARNCNQAKVRIGIGMNLSASGTASGRDDRRGSPAGTACEAAAHPRPKGL
ncbi:MAG: hypothetical protein FJZ00_00320 [Candidatus Sericytochromatia bacterium]|uniref:Uncharacterized protein n=1 Tax=Candidatus Tanganyikabacteria bacterium TaxID=2961651 RepID=A0A937X079_9BACT|nr:hypothetical protein [Candidatus Tanganyikabacteria bacterium]